MKIGILGSGEVGQALARGFQGEGHEVKIGTRTPRETFVSFKEAAEFGELLVVATVWGGTKSAIDMAGAAAFTGKTVIDVTNPLVTTEGAPPALALGHTDSAGEHVQRWLPDSHVVKAFNIVGHGFMYKPQFTGGPPTMFIAGNDAGAKKTVTQILSSFGWETIEIGGIEGARVLEPMCILWVVTGIHTGNWHQAFKMLRA